VIVEKTYVVFGSPRMSNSDVPVRSVNVFPQVIRVSGVRSAPRRIPLEGNICGRQDFHTSETIGCTHLGCVRNTSQGLVLAVPETSGVPLAAYPTARQL
jgi:hypothetical protein